MGYEIRYTYHPRKEDGPGYNEEIVEEKNTKVGKPFDDTPLEKCAAAIMSQLARRDVWVTDVEIFELVKKQIKFKEAADGKGIVLKGKKFSLGKTAADMVEEEEVPTQMIAVQSPQPVPQSPQPNPVAKHPHEMMQVQKQDGIEALYSNPNTNSVGLNPRTVDQNKKLYQVIFDPEVHLVLQAKQMKVKLTEGKRYNVHASQKANIAVTDDSGQVLVIDEKFFSAAGQGLLGDAELGFSAESSKPNRPKLAFEDQMFTEHPEQQKAQPVQQNESAQNIPGNIPLDDGALPEELLEVPDLRPNLKV